MEKKVKFKTVLTKEVLEKANAHHTLFFTGIPGGPGQHASDIALRALRDDIQAMIDDIVKVMGQHFWAEVFGDDRSDCQYCASGYCALYHGNDGINFACSYAYEVQDYDCVCIRTKAVERAFPDMFQPTLIGDYPKGKYYDTGGGLDELTVSHIKGEGGPEAKE